MTAVPTTAVVMPPRPRARTWRRVVRSPLTRGWLISHAAVSLALLAAQWAPHHVQASLLGWDAAWYRDIAVSGYAGSPVGAVRFFPAWPLLASGVASVSRLAPDVVLVLLANGFALLFVHLVRTIAGAEGLSPRAVDAAGYAAWFAPAAFVLVMGYSEALFGVASCLVLLWARRRAWWLCALAAVVAGALRPTGVLLGVPLAVEAVVFLRTRPGRGPAVAATNAVTAPVVGLGLFLGWSAASTGDLLAPFRAQTAVDLRGGVVVDPLRAVVIGVQGLVGGHPDANFLAHVVVIPVAVGLVVVGWRRLPASFTAYAVVVLLVALTAAHFGSFERYAGATVPLLLAAGFVLEARPRLRRVAAVVGPVVMATLAFLAFADVYVP